MANLTSLDAVRRYLGLRPTETESDAVLEDLIAGVSAWFEGEIDRQLDQTTVTEKHIHRGGDVIETSRRPVTAVSALSWDGNTVDAAATDTDAGWYILDGGVRVRWSSIPEGALVSVSYTGGNATIPADVERAVKHMIALDFRERGHLGTQTVSALGTSVSFLPSIVPNAVQRVIDRYRRMSA